MPVPDWAATIRSLPLRMIGMAFRWSGVGSTKPAARTPLTSADGKPRVVKGNEASGFRNISPASERLAGRPWRPKPTECKGLASREQRSFAALLTGRTEEGGALGLHDPPDGRSAAPAGLAATVVDEELAAVGAGLVPQRAVGAEGGAHARDGLLQNRRSFSRDRLPVGGGERHRAPPRIDAGPVQDLARIDVADPRDALLIQQERLDGRSGAASDRAQRFSGGGRGDRIGAELAQAGAPRDRPRVHQLEQAKAPRILEPQLTALGEGDARVDVRRQLRRRALHEQPTTAHAEVRDERETAVQVREQVLSMAANRDEGPAPKPAIEPAAHGSAQPLAGEPDRADGPAGDGGFEVAPDGLDFGQLGHPPTLGVRSAAGQGSRSVRFRRRFRSRP